MDIDQVAQLVETGGESETLEFKETTGTRREASRTVCAFLNQRGGQVLFGVTAVGVVAGQQVSDRTIEELSAELQRIDPPAFPTVERVRLDGNHEVIVVNVDQGTLSRTPTAASPTAESGTQHWQCPQTSTTAYSSSGCTASNAGRISPP